MKKYLPLFISIILLTGLSSQGKENAEQEKEAIKKVIQEQTIASSNRDLNLLTSYWVQDESAVRMFSGKNNYNMLSGWKEIDNSYKNGVKNNPEPAKIKKEYSDFKIKVYKESAWAVFNEKTYDSEGKLVNVQIGTRFLEKKDRKWKIVYMAFINTSSYEEAK